MRTLLLALLVVVFPSMNFAAPATKPTRTLAITVLDAATGKPLPGAVISNNRGRKEIRLPVDDAGHATVSYEQGATFLRLSLHLDGYVPTSVLWSGNNGEPASLPDTYTIRMSAGKTIGGLVVDEQGNPVTGVKVTLYNWVNPEVASGTAVSRLNSEVVETDAAGHWKFSGYPADAPKIGIGLTHPDFISDQRYPAGEAKALLDQSLKLVIPRGLDMIGEVISVRGKPIKGAKISTIRSTRISNDAGITVTTDANGKFRLSHLRPQEAVVTVTAVGFAPELMRVKVAPDVQPLKFILPDASRLAGRVLDDQGKPIGKVRVGISEWRGAESLPFSVQTDADGRFAWVDAPADAVAFSFDKQGYKYILRQPLKAGPDEVVVKMLPLSTFSGTVTDANTHQPISKFRVIGGTQYWQQRQPSFSVANARMFHDGKYEMPIDANNETLASYVRIEAEGYEPAISPPATSGSATFSPSLKPGKLIAGILTSPDGQPVAGAKVHMAFPGTQVNIFGGRIEGSETLNVKTDEQGHFRFDPQIGAIYFVVLHDKGYAFVKGDVTAEKADLKLTPWSRIEGIYRPGGKVAEHGPQINIDVIRDRSDVAPRLEWVLQSSVDSAGQLRAERVPSFDGRMCSLTVGLYGTNTSDQRWLPIRLEPGKTLQLNIEGGRTLTGRAVPASPDDAITDARGSISLRPVFNQPASQWPTSVADAVAHAEPLYGTSLRPDGSFAVPSIPAGNYEYRITMYGVDAASGSGVLTIDPGDGSVDVGAIKYTRGSVKVGQPAPATLGRTFDEKPIRTAEFGGKYIVAVVWDSCSGRSDAQLPHLSKLAEKFASNPKVALISVNMDTVSCGMTGTPRRPGTLDHAAWVRGYLPMSDEQLMRRIGGKWPAILIIGPDGNVIARDLEGGNVAEKLAEAMRR